MSEEWTLVKIKKLAEECLAHHGVDAFCEDWDCRTVLQVFAELEQSRAEVKELKEVAENWRTMEQASSLMAEEMVKKAEKAEAEIKRLRAMLAIGHFVIRE